MEAYILNQVLGHIVFAVMYLSSPSVATTETEATQAPAPVHEAQIVQLEKAGPPLPPEWVMIARAGE
ncbi:MAG: hypothetical protein WCY71_11320 [Halothiobacillaceae bacterium]|jgi:hypothetical protein